jgi:hypothetical protein
MFMIQAGKRYASPAGAEMIVTKAGNGTLSDGDVALIIKGSEENFAGANSGGDELTLGRRYQSEDGDVVVLVTKAGKCDLRYDGNPMEVMQPKKLPSSD